MQSLLRLLFTTTTDIIHYPPTRYHSLHTYQLPLITTSVCLSLPHQLPLITTSVCLSLPHQLPLITTSVCLSLPHTSYHSLLHQFAFHYHIPVTTHYYISLPFITTPVTTHYYISLPFITTYQLPLITTSVCLSLPHQLPLITTSVCLSLPHTSYHSLLHQFAFHYHIPVTTHYYISLPFITTPTTTHYMSLITPPTTTHYYISCLSVAHQLTLIA